MHASDPTFPLYPVLSFLAIIVSFIPFPWHFRARNIGTCSYMLSTGLYSLVEFINSIIWADNVNNIAPVWCDISVLTIIGASVGITSSTLAISRQLYHISTMNGRSTTPQEKRREIIINCVIAFGIPLLVMALHFVVQPRRFDIFEEIGCQPATFNTVASYILYFMWPVLIGVCSFIYSVLTLRNFYNHRVEFAKIASTNSGMSPSRYIRLMLLVFVDMFCNTPIGVFAIIVAARAVVLPFSALSESLDFTSVQLVSASVWKANRLDRAAVEINRWVPVFCSFVFFVFFGFAEEAKKNYRKAYESSKKFLGCRGSRMKADGFPKPSGSQMWDMISNAELSNSTTSTLTPSTLPTQDKYKPDDSYLSQTDTLNSPSSPYSASSCTSSLRPLLVRSGVTSSQQSLLQASFSDSDQRAGFFAGQLKGKTSPAP
ncbi:pheromone A receptor-domain-containing protein [Lentinula aff. detonsa]|uniref:Pheromone A receptor-domain-containing protein n=1 Tax=Lentinula aff. detonsa TaxID=2804958 RepID=A0AA38L4B7_9AGAR|nr:pheromone A receptor-domain-containing protein [Lentinula aff. detonsa]